MRAFIILLLCTISFTNIIPHLGKPKTHTPRRYKVSLDDSPEERWAPLAKDYKHQLEHFMWYFDWLPIPKKIFKQLDFHAHNQFKHQDFVTEIDGFAKVSGIQFGKLYFLNWMYQYSTLKGCTSILVRNGEGRIIHGRNLDFGMWSLLARLIVTIDYYRGDNLVYTVDTVLGSVFALTGIRFGSFAISVNTRYGGTFSDVIAKVKSNDTLPSCWLVKRILEEQSTYQGALKRLEKQNISSRIYFIISGVNQNEGAVIERNSVGVHAVYNLNRTHWFLVQTNYDRDQRDPLLDSRRNGVEKKMKEYGQKRLNETVLFEDFMSVWPTLNIETIMTSIMVPITGYHNVTVWYAKNPSGKQTSGF